MKTLTKIALLGAGFFLSGCQITYWPDSYKVTNNNGKIDGKYIISGDTITFTNGMNKSTGETYLKVYHYGDNFPVGGIRPEKKYNNIVYYHNGQKVKAVHFD